MKEKKNNKGLVWLIAILIILVLGLVGYIVYDKVLSAQKNSINNDETTTTTITTNTEKKENITEEDIEKYLSFVPFTTSLIGGAYTKEKQTIDTIDKNVIYEYLFNNLEEYSTNKKILSAEMCGESNYCQADKYILLNDFYNNMKKMYNLKIDNNKLNDFNAEPYIVIKADEYYAGFLGAPIPEYKKVNDKIKYRFEDKLLIIYEQAGFIEISESNINIYKYNNEVIVKENNIAEMSPNEVEKIANESIKFIKENIKDFPQYKHVFKINDKGDYYWYSTELAN